MAGPALRSSLKARAAARPFRGAGWPGYSRGMAAGLTLILADRSPGRPALSALAGAVESDASGRGVALRCARGREALLSSVREALSGGGAAVVAWTFFSFSFAEVSDDLGWLRERLGSPRLLHLAGGPHASAEPAETLRAGFDLVAIGEGEGTLAALLGRLLRGQGPRGPGLAWLEEGELRRGGRAPAVDLDACPPGSPTLGWLGPVEITRGCVHACRFCQTPFLAGARLRHRSVEAVAEWVRFAAPRGLRDVRFLTSSALAYGSADGSPRLDRVEALLAAVRAAAGPRGRIFLGSFPSELRPEHVSAEALDLLRRYVHNDNLIVGAQSGSGRLLAASHRGHGVEEVRRAVRLIREAGFQAQVDFIFGMPGETPEDAAATRLLMAELADRGARVHAHAFLPLPGTPWRDAAPGSVDAATGRLLEHLAGRGRAFGPWRRQEGIASGLATRRRRAAASP